MTEQEWQVCADPTRMLAFLRILPGPRGDRKHRLLGVAGCRHSNCLFRSESLHAIEAAERFADGLIDESTLLDARHRADPWVLSDLGWDNHRGAWEAWATTHSDCLAYPNHYAMWLDDYPILIREIFGNPFRPVTPDPAWLTATVVSLAQAIYADRAFDRLPILADALEDAGCTNADLLNHCRQPGDHVRGCWLVDLVLGKS